MVSKRADSRYKSGPSKSWLKAKWAPKGIPIKKANAQWIKPRLVGHVRFLKGEGGLRNATLTEVRDED
jgi:hypothetical protein